MKYVSYYLSKISNFTHVLTTAQLKYGRLAKLYQLVFTFIYFFVLLLYLYKNRL